MSQATYLKFYAKVLFYKYLILLINFNVSVDDLVLDFSSLQPGRTQAYIWQHMVSNLGTEDLRPPASLFLGVEEGFLVAFGALQNGVGNLDVFESEVFGELTNLVHDLES